MDRKERLEVIGLVAGMVLGSLALIIGVPGILILVNIYVSKWLSLIMSLAILSTAPFVFAWLRRWRERANPWTRLGSWPR